MGYNLGKVILIDLDFIKDNVLSITNTDLCVSLYLSLSHKREVNYVLIDDRLNNHTVGVADICRTLGFITHLKSLKVLHDECECVIIDDYRTYLCKIDLEK